MESAMNKNTVIKSALADYQKTILNTLTDAGSVVRGHRVCMVSDYHDQPIGSSWPSQKGKIFEVLGMYLSNNRFYLELKGLRTFPRLDDVEFID
jgi:hypothetical protein